MKAKKDLIRDLNDLRHQVLAALDDLERLRQLGYAGCAAFICTPSAYAFCKSLVDLALHSLLISLLNQLTEINAQIEKGEKDLRIMEALLDALCNPTPEGNRC